MPLNKFDLLMNPLASLQDVGETIWRQNGEPVAELNTVKECLEHAILGGMRSSVLAASLRACVNLIFVLLRIRKLPREIRFSAVRHAVLGVDTWRSAAMLGTFTSLYKFLLNALPILIPTMKLSPTEVHDDTKAKASSPRARDRHSVIRKKTTARHAAIAGAVAGGVAIMCEKKARGVFALQLFVRGLQGAYHSSEILHVPHGDVLLFCLAFGQAFYSYNILPETLSRSYTAWLRREGRMSSEFVRMNSDLVHKGICSIPDIDELISRKDITASNISDLRSLRSQILSGTKDGDYFPRYAPCAAVHPSLSSCNSVLLDRFLTAFKRTFFLAAILQFFPSILFKRKALMRDPKSVLVRAAWSCMRTAAFMGFGVPMTASPFCYKTKLHKYLTLLRSSSHPPHWVKVLPQSLIDLLIAPVTFWLQGVFGGLALLIEEKRRREEVAMYVLPTSLENLWTIARRKGWVFGMGKSGEVLLSMIGMAMMMATYQNNPQCLSGLVRGALYQFIGPN